MDLDRVVPNIPEDSGPCACTLDLRKGNSVKGAETERGTRNGTIPS
jgi:hypothetical protein